MTSQIRAAFAPPPAYTRCCCVVQIGRSHVELSFYGDHEYVIKYLKTMSEMLMKEMERVSLDPVKAKKAPGGVSSILLVDEQENLQVIQLTYLANANT